MAGVPGVVQGSPFAMTEAQKALAAASRIAQAIPGNPLYIGRPYPSDGIVNQVSRALAQGLISPGSLRDLGLNPASFTTTRSNPVAGLRMDGNTTPRRVAQQAARLSIAPTTVSTAVAQNQNAAAQFSLGGILGGIGRGLAGVADTLIPGGGRIADAILPGNQGFSQPQSIPFSGPALPTMGGSNCPSGCFKVGQRCVCPGDAFPGGAPLTRPTSGRAVDNFGNAVMGAFNMPALEPAIEQRVHRSCPKGMVLGEDDLCYPKAILGRRSKFRKWKGAPRPAVSAAQMKAIRQAARAKEKIKSLGKDVGLKVTNR